MVFPGLNEHTHGETFWGKKEKKKKHQEPC